jgi:hypothetical protein
VDLAASCSLNDEDLAERRRQWRALAPALVESSETIDGYRATYRGDEQTAAALQALIEAERVCCPDFDWRLEREGDLVRLEVSYAAAASR